MESKEAKEDAYGAKGSGSGAKEVEGGESAASESKGDSLSSPRGLKIESMNMRDATTGTMHWSSPPSVRGFVVDNFA
jgi:hypothetical protein